jgi:Toprim domain
MSDAADLAQRLAREAEAVCRAYLPNGRRNGHYWIAGDVHGARGKSLFVKLSGERAGKWTDAATGEHGDLLDLIALNKGFTTFRDTLEEARRFLREPPCLRSSQKVPPSQPAHDSSAAAAKLYSLSHPAPGTLAETYLRGRGITASLSWPSLRFHPGCYFRAHDGAPLEQWPAVLGAVTDLTGKLTGLQRTWLARDGSGKAPFDEPRRAMGHLLGHAVRFGEPSGIMAAGEGIETMLSLLSLFPALPMAAGLSATHLSALIFPPDLRRFYMLRDNDAAGDCAEERLTGRCRDAGIEMRVLIPARKDLNIDLQHEPAHAVKTRMLAQMQPEDRSRFRA